MSAGFAPPIDTLDRADSLAIRLLTLDSVAAARQVGPWMLVVPNERGVGALRRHGKAALVATWQAAAGHDASGPGLHWRLLESLPPAGSAAEAGCMRPVRAPILGEPQLALPGVLRCALRVPLDLAVFEGHFPAIPLVPAVVQIGWAIDLLRRHLRSGARFAGIAATKFRRLMLPGMALSLSLELDGDRLRFEYRTADAPVSTGRLRLEADRG